MGCAMYATRPSGLASIFFFILALRPVLGEGLPPGHPRMDELRWAVEVRRPGTDIAARIDIPPGDAKNERELALDATVAGVKVRVLRYAPRMDVREEMAPAGNGRPAVRVHGRLEARTLDRWLLCGDPVRNRIETEFLALTYRGPLSEAEVEQERKYLRELTRPLPKLIVERRADGGREVHVIEKGSKIQVRDPAMEIEVVRLVNFFGIDQRGQVVDRGDPGRRMNPAAELRVRRGASVRTAWLFSLFPQFSKGADDEDFVLHYHCPAEANPHKKLTLVLVDRGPRTLLLVSKGDSVWESEVDPGEKKDILGFLFSVEERIPSARVLQKAEAAPTGRPAVEVALEKGGTSTRWWVPAGTSERIRLGAETYDVGFGPTRSDRKRTPSLPKGHPPIGNP